MSPPIPGVEDRSKDIYVERSLIYIISLRWRPYVGSEIQKFPNEKCPQSGFNMIIMRDFLTEACWMLPG